MSKKLLPSQSGKSSWGLLVGLLISGGIIAALAFALDWTLFLRELKKVNFWYLLLYQAVFALTFWLRAARWRYLLPSHSELSTRYLFDSYSSGLLGTFLLPFRAGELIRAWTLKRWQGIPFALGLASVVTERVFDILAILFLLGLALSGVENVPSEISSGAVLLGAAAGCVLLVMILCYFMADRMLQLGEWLLDKVLGEKHPHMKQTLLHFAADIINGFRAISNFGELLMVLVLSLIIWLTFALTAQIGLWCFGEFPSLWVGITLNSIIALAVAVPSAPGFIGVYQAGCWLGLSVLFGYSKEFSIAYAVLVHALQALLVFLIGFYCLHRNGLGIADLRKGRDESEEAATH